MDYRFKIGEVAGIFDISIRALRLYDKLGVLKPELVDDRTGYRYYSTGQIQELQTILSLKSVGFSLMDVKAVLDDAGHPARLLELLRQKRQRLLDDIEIAKFKVRLIADIEKNAAEEAGCGKDGKLNPEGRAYRLSRLVSLENSKVENILTEVLWL